MAVARTAVAWSRTVQFDVLGVAWNVHAVSCKGGRRKEVTSQAET